MYKKYIYALPIDPDLIGVELLAQRKL